jgi:hypothetical protein
MSTAFHRPGCAAAALTCVAVRYARIDRRAQRPSRVVVTPATPPAVELDAAAGTAASEPHGWHVQDNLTSTEP